MDMMTSVRVNGKRVGGNRSNIERSEIRILLCDSNAESQNEVFALLCQCSYQVTSVWSTREIFDALDSNAPHIDIILAEVDLLMANGAEVLRYIMCHKEFQHIPVIILSTRDKVSVTINGLRLGAADYLVKPLEAKELSNMWTHIRKRRNEALEGCCSSIEHVSI